MARLTLLVALSRVATGQLALPTFSKLTDLPLDEHGHLKDHMLLMGERCGLQLYEEVGVDLPSAEDLPEREFGLVAGPLASALRLAFIDGDYGEQGEGGGGGGGEGVEQQQGGQGAACPAAVALERGTLLQHVLHHHERYDPPGGKALDPNNAMSMRRFKTSFQRWLSGLAQVEVGWMNYHSDLVRVVWVSPDTGEEVLQADLEYGEQRTHWRTVFLGHKFRVRDLQGQRDPHTKEFPLLREMVARHNEIFVMGKQPPLSDREKGGDHSREIANTDVFERRRAQRVQRTFTEHGFSKVPVPLDVWGSMHTYYYNNQRNIAREEWGGKGIYVNWWHSDPYMIQPPHGLKTRWHDALRPLAEEWIGVSECVHACVVLCVRGRLRNQSRNRSTASIRT